MPGWCVRSDVNEGEMRPEKVLSSEGWNVMPVSISTEIHEISIGNMHD